MMYSTLPAFSKLFGMLIRSNTQLLVNFLISLCNWHTHQPQPAKWQAPEVIYASTTFMKSLCKWHVDVANVTCNVQKKSYDEYVSF